MVKVDPEGKDNPAKRCQHVNYVTKRAKGLEDEQEYLFTQYAPFEIKSVLWKEQTKENYHQITLFALSNGKDITEDLPLAPWS